MPVEEHSAAAAEWSRQSWWKQLLTRAPGSGAVRQAHYEPVAETFTTLNEALESAERHADAAPPDAAFDCVVILDADGIEVGGFWTDGGGPI